MQDMAKDAVPPQAVSFNAVLKACAKKGPEVLRNTRPFVQPFSIIELARLHPSLPELRFRNLCWEHDRAVTSLHP